MEFRDRRLSMSIGAMMAAAMGNIQLISLGQPVDFSAPKRRRTGVTYPHSSTRQQERFARQLAAGQVKFTN